VVTDEPGRPEATAAAPAPVGSTSFAPANPPGNRATRRRSRRRRLTLGAAGVAVVLVAAAVTLLVLTDGSPRTPTATTHRPVAAASSTTTTSPVTGTTVIPRSSNPIVVLAQQYDGRYAGMFTNTTFHTTGLASLDVRVDPGSSELAVTADLNGDLFGGGARLVRRIEATVTLGGSNPSVVTRTAAFGLVTAKLGSGLSVVLTAPDVPDPKVKTFELTGTLRSDQRGFDATFAVGFRDGRSAQGTVTVLCAPQGQRPSQVTTLCAPM
jgi:hypothetical protein